MSRCFPFPPPGYEKRPRSDHIDLLTKEKHKEKKHKKENKDKEKREGKDRKHKDRHKEKKDRKEKHKEQKRDKNREREKARVHDDRRTEEKTTGHNEDSICVCSKKAEEFADSKFTEELSRRFKDDGASSRMPENHNASIHKSVEEFGSAGASKMGKASGSEMVANHVGQMHDRSIGPVKDTIQIILGIKKANERPQNIVDPIVIGQVERKLDSMGQPAANGSGKRGEGKERSYEKNGMASYIISKEQRRNDGFEQPMEKGTENIEGKEVIGRQKIATYLTDKEPRRNQGMAQQMQNDSEQFVRGKKAQDGEADHGKATNIVSREQKRKDGLGQHMEKNTENVEHREVNERLKMFIEKERSRNERMAQPMDNAEQVVGWKKAKDKEADFGKTNDHKHGDQIEKKLKKKDKHRQKGEKEKEKTRNKHEHGYNENGKNNRPEKFQSAGLTINCLPQKDGHRYSDNEEYLKKRKDQEMNGYFHENDMRPNKLLKPAPSSHLHVENGGTLDSCLLLAPVSSVKLGAANCKIDSHLVTENIENKVNRVGGGPPSVAANTCQNGEVSLKPPHPEYLSVIYNVPKMEEWPESDDQEWLFCKDNSRSKPKADFEADKIAEQVWSEALRIDSADVFALPYVIPY